MKLSDKAIEAALEEGKLWCEGMQLNSPNPAVWKVLRVTNKNGNYKTIKKFNTREERDEALERLRAEAMVNAAYAAQFQGEEYAGLIKRLRDWGAMNYKECDEAADAIEMLLAKLNDKPKPNDKAIEALADALKEHGGHHHWFPKSSPADWRNLDPIGRREFLDIAGYLADAAYAAQFQIEEYAELVERLRAAHKSNRIEWEAADAIETVLAERDALSSEIKTICERESTAVAVGFELKTQNDRICSERAALEGVTKKEGTGDE